MPVNPRPLQPNEWEVKKKKIKSQNIKRWLCLRAAFKRNRRFGEDLKCATDFWWFFFIDLVQSGSADAVCCQSSESGAERWVRPVSHDYKKK